MATTYPVRTRRWTRKEYARLVEVGVLPGWLVRQQDPIALDDESEPEPDLIVVPGQTLRPGATVSPLTRPDITIPVAGLLP